MKSGGRLGRGKGLESKRNRLPRFSKSRQSAREATRQWREEYLAAYPFCEIGQVLSRNQGKYEIAFACLGTASCLHERQKRSSQGSLTDPANVMRACNLCNSWVEQNGKLAAKLGLTVLAEQIPSQVPIK